MPYLPGHTENVWRNVWTKEVSPTIRGAFSHRLFIEGYKKFHAFIPMGTKKILEVGTGSGRYGVKLAEDFPHAQITAVDFLDESLAVAEALAKAVKVSNIFFQNEKVEALSFPEASFDVVISDALIQHVADDQQAIREVARVLRPGGTLLLSSVNALSVHAFLRFVAENIFRNKYKYGFERLYTRKAFFRLAKNAGLEVVVVSGFYPAYGIYRLKEYWGGFAPIGRALNRFTRILDSLTGDFFSSHFGFMLFLVAKKPL